MILSLRAASANGLPTSSGPRFIRLSTAIVIAVVIASSVAGCGAEVMQRVREIQEQRRKIYAAGAELAKKHTSPEVLDHCKFKLTGTQNSTIEYVEPWRYSPHAAQFVEDKVYGLFKPKPEGQLTAALISKCSGKNLLGSPVSHYCGCFYEVDAKQLKFVRALSALDFIRQTTVYVTRVR
jgi:hypothetical protein